MRSSLSWESAEVCRDKCCTEAARVADSGAPRCATGYLPGMMLPHIKFFAAMSLLYITLGVAWAGAYARHWKEVFTLQHAISAIVALGMMEMSTWWVVSLLFALGQPCIAPENAQCTTHVVPIPTHCACAPQHGCARLLGSACVPYNSALQQTCATLNVCNAAPQVL